MFSPASIVISMTEIEFVGMQQKEHAVHDQRWMDRWMEGMHDARVDGTELQTVWHVSTPINPQTLLTSPLPLALSSRLLGTKSGVGSISEGRLATARGQGPCLSALLLAS